MSRSIKQEVEAKARDLYAGALDLGFDEATAEAKARALIEEMMTAMPPIKRVEAERGAWWFERRPEQEAPVDEAGNRARDWRWWLVSAGRGFGKSRMGAEFILDCVESGQVTAIALVGKTAADVRDVMVLGPSGIIACARRRGGDVPTYTPSTRTLTWKSGAQAKTFSAEEPDQLRGPQHQVVWWDEMAAAQYPQETLDQISFGLRIPWRDGRRARCLITTTPKRVPAFVKFIKRAGVFLTRGRTSDNVDNLDPEALRDLLDTYQGTRLGKQELDAELLEDVEGALWTRERLDDLRVKTTPELVRKFVAVDPAATSGPTSAETGIIVVGVGIDGICYVLADRSCRLPPSGWGARVCEAAEDFHADAIVVEQNNGGEMVESTIRMLNPPCKIIRVHASDGKRTRAAPVEALYQQGRVRHVGTFAELEDQQCTFTGLAGETSPDRLDALVWAVTHAMVVKKRPDFVMA